MVATYFHTVHSIVFCSLSLFFLFPADAALAVVTSALNASPHMESPRDVCRTHTMAVNCTNYINKFQHFQHLLLHSGPSMIEWLHFLLPMAWNAL